MTFIETKIRSAAVYRRGCEITNTGAVHLTAGTHRCRIEGIGSSAAPESIRISTSKGLTASDVQTAYPDEKEQKEITRETDEKIVLCNAAIDACDVQAQLWKNNLSFKSRDGLDLAGMEGYESRLPEKLTAIAGRKIELEKEKEELLKQREELQKKIGRPYVTAVMECEAEGDYLVQVQYYDPCAFWHPVYEIRTDGESGPLTLRLRAGVRQTTGLDWEDVSLKLYTGNPAVSADIPVLLPAHLQFRREPVKLKNARMAMPMGMMASAMTDGAAMEETVQMDYAAAKGTEAEVNVQETMTEYDLPGTWNLVSDGQETMADLSEKQIECEYHIVAVPKKDNRACLAASVKTSDLADVIHSRAAVYLKDTYTGEVLIEPDQTKDTYELSLGRDESVSVRRTQKKKYTSSVLLKNQYRTEYVYETVIVSSKQKPCRITVIDQIPVSDEKTIIVEKGNLSGGKLNEETGEVVWDMELAANESRTAELSWNTVWPKDREIAEVQTPAGRRYCPQCGAEVFGKFCPECGTVVS